MKRVVIGIALVASVLAVQAPAAGTADEAQALVKKAVELIKTGGKDKAFAAFNDPKGEFVKGDLYIFIVDYTGLTLAHGGNAKLIGKNMMELKDADGKEFMKECIATSKKGGGWVDYKWTNPETKKVQDKSSYVMPAEGHEFLVGCGIYK